MKKIIMTTNYQFRNGLLENFQRKPLGKGTACNNNNNNIMTTTIMWINYASEWKSEETDGGWGVMKLSIS